MADLKEYQKKPFEVSVMRAPAGLCIYNSLDISSCMTTEDRCFVVTGLEGEQYPIEKEKLNRYLTLEGGKLDAESWKLGERKTVKADTSCPHILVYFPTETEYFPAPASWKMKDRLRAFPGDAVAYPMMEDGSPDLGNKYVISVEVFDRTYEEV